MIIAHCDFIYLYFILSRKWTIYGVCVCVRSTWLVCTRNAMYKVKINAWTTCSQQIIQFGQLVSTVIRILSVTRSTFYFHKKIKSIQIAWWILLFWKRLICTYFRATFREWWIRTYRTHGAILNSLCFFNESKTNDVHSSIFFVYVFFLWNVFLMVCCWWFV